MPRTPHATLGSPNLLTDKERDELDTLWFRHPKAHRLIGKYLDNPLVLTAMEEVRDGYFQLFSERRYLQRLQRDDPKNETLTKRLEDVEYDLIMHNHKSFKRFTYPGYGVTVAKQKEMYHGGDRPPHLGDPMSPEEAKKIVAPLIGATIDCFEGLNRFYHFKKTPRMTVPGQASLYASPDMLNKRRSSSRKSWIDAFNEAPDPSKDRQR